MRRRPDRQVGPPSAPATPVPRRRWFRVVVPLVLLAFVVSVLAVEGYTSRGFAGDQEGRGERAGRSGVGVPREVAEGGPVVDAGHDPPRTYRAPARTVVLTFDDGPDPTWTPRIQEVLDRYDVPGTFFVTGRQTARHPELVRDLIRSGHEIGVHTFSHPDLAAQSEDAVDRELAFTQLALAGAAGVHSSLVRMPYSSTTGALDGPSWSVARYLGEKGYVLAFVDQDTRD